MDKENVFLYFQFLRPEAGAGAGVRPTVFGGFPRLWAGEAFRTEGPECKKTR